MNFLRLSLNLLRRDWRAGEWRVLRISPRPFTGEGQGITSDLAALPPSRMASSFIRG